MPVICVSVSRIHYWCIIRLYIGILLLRGTPFFRLDFQALLIVLLRNYGSGPDRKFFDK